MVSLAGLKAYPNNISNNASTFAVVAMTKSAALEYADYNIRINVVCPSYLASPLLGRLFHEWLEMEIIL